MTGTTRKTEFESDEEFFRYHLGRHGIDRSLSALWQHFNGECCPAASGSGTYPAQSL